MAESKFRQLCIERKLTAQAIENVTGIKKRTIYSYFDGSRSPSRATRRILRDKLDIDTRVFD